MAGDDLTHNAEVNGGRLADRPSGLTGMLESEESMKPFWRGFIDGVAFGPLLRWWNKPGDEVAAAMEDSFQTGRRVGIEESAQVCENNEMPWADEEWNSAVNDCAEKIRLLSNAANNRQP